MLRAKTDSIDFGLDRLSIPALCRLSLASGIVATACLLTAPAHGQPEQGALSEGTLRSLIDAKRTPVLPDSSNSSTADDSILPPLVVREDASTNGLAGGVRVFVTAYEIAGSTVLSDEELERLTGPYTGRPISYADLQQLRDELTQAYVSRGYVTSGAVLPDQSLASGRVRIEIEEGLLDDVQVEVDGRLRSSYVERRIRRGLESPINVYQLERRLQRLQRDPRIASLRASVEPTQLRGEARLRVEVTEAPGFSAQLEADNGLAPSIGAERTSLTLSHQNLTGSADALQIRYGQSHGLREWSGSYAFPLGATDMRFEIFARSSESDVVEAPFNELDIESRSATYGASLHQPILSDLDRSLELTWTAEYRRSKSFLLGSAFSFSPGVEDGESELTVLRFAQDFSRSTQVQALALRSTVSVGVGAFGATQNGDRDIPDGQFVAWLGQAQYARRLGLLDAQLIARAQVQLSNEPLLGLEQFSLGGRSSVRGYRENELVRDNGAFGSVELRLPVWRRFDGSMSLELAPFFDAGQAWNRRRPTRGVRTLSSAGLGARLSLGRVDLEITWADDLRELPSSSDDRDLQDAGLHFRISSRF